MIFILIAVFFLLALDRARHPKHPLQLNVYFGVPGSGKTTYAAYLAREAQRESKVLRLCRRFPNRFTNWILNGKNWKRPYPVWSNVPISGTLRINAKEDLGVHLIQDGKLIIDEAGVEFNNRDYKSFPKWCVRGRVLSVFRGHGRYLAPPGPKLLCCPPLCPSLVCHYKTYPP